MADESVGSIVGYLRLNDDAFLATADKATRKADELARLRPTVTVTANTGTAIAKLEAVAAATNRLQTAQEKIGQSQSRYTSSQERLTRAQKAYSDALASTEGTEKSRADAITKAEAAVKRATVSTTTARNNLSKSARDAEVAEIGLASAFTRSSAAADKSVASTDRAHKSLGLLATSIVGLGPALIPLGAVAAASFGALAEGAGVAVLAIKGIQAEMKAGTALGEQYTKSLGGLKSDLAGLEHTAAAGVAPSVFKGVAQLHALMPALNAQTKLYSGILGDAADHVVHGLAGGFVALQPLFTTILRDADKLAAAFDSYANGGGLAKFGAYVQQNLPAIENDLKQVATLVVNILDAGAGSGLSTLNLIGKLAGALDAVPLPVLKVLVPALSGAVLAAKGFAVFNTVNKALDAYVLKAGAAAVASQGLAAAEGEAAAAGDAEAVSQARAGGGGVLGKAGVAGGLAGRGLLGLGGGLALPVTAAAYGVSVLGRLATGQGKNSFGVSGQGASLNVTGKVNAAADNSGTVSAAAADKSAVALSAQAAAAKVAAAANGVNASALGLTTGAYKTASAAAAAQTAQDKANTAAMQAENDAAGLLEASLGKLGTNGASVAEAQTAAASSTLALTAAFKANGSSVSTATAKGIANRQALESQRDSALTLAEAIGKQTGSTIKETASLNKSKQAALDKARAQGDLTDKVRAYIEKLYAIPPQKLTKVDLQILATADTAAAVAQINALKSSLAGIASKGGAAVGFSVNQSISNLENRTLNRAGGGVFPGYAPGHDSIHAMLSPGEAVLTPEATRAIGGAAAVYALNRSTTNRPVPIENYAGGGQKFAGGGLAGNAATIASQLKGALGLNNIALAGVLGNWKIESGLSPSAYNPRENAHGLAQWEGGRANDATRSNSLSRQVSNAIRELQGPYSRALSAIKSAKTPSAAAAAFDRLFEGSSGSTRSQRESAADAFYRQLGGTKGSSTSPVAASGGSGASPASSAAASAAAKAQTVAGYRSDGAQAGNSYLSGLGLSQQVQGARSDFSTALGDVSAYQKAHGGNASKAIAQLRRDNLTLNAEIKTRDKLAGQLVNANQKLSDAKTSRADEYYGVKGSITGTVDLSSSGYADTYSIKTLFANKVAAALQFGKDEKLALAHGVDPALVQQLVDAGPDAAAVSLHTLATASRSDVKAIDKLQSQLNKAGTSVGLYTAHKFYDQGVNAAQGIVNGLNASEKKVNSAIAKLAAAMVKTFRHELGIASPSKVFRAHGRNLGDGLVLGIHDRLPAVKLATNRLSGAATPVGSGSGAVTIDGIRLTGGLHILSDGRVDTSDMLVAVSMRLGNGVVL